MFRDHDVVVSLTGMTAVLLDASLCSVERHVAAESAAFGYAEMDDIPAHKVPHFFKARHAPKLREPNS
jgi:hypothetical protein